jgi:hypothetical protein
MQPLQERLLGRLALPSAQGRGGLETLSSAVTVMKVRDRIAAAEYSLLRRAETTPGVDRDVIERLLKHGEAGLLKLDQERERARLHPDELFGLEAVIESDGSRPVLFVQDGTIDLDSPDLAGDLSRPWREAAEKCLPSIGKIVQSVGAIQLPAFDNMRIGTGFAVGPGLILTNRHVLEELATFQDGAWAPRYEAEIDFRGEFEREFERESERRFTLGPVVRFGPDPINRQIDFAHLDFALIRVQGDLQDFPPALALQGDAGALKVVPGKAPSIYVVGFPAKPLTTTPGEDPGPAGNPPPKHEYEGVIERLFRNRFGSKRWAPGYVDAGPGQLVNDKRRWVLSHDASTLAGNSGSCVVDFSRDGARVVGLHFGGRLRVENWAHVMAALREQFDGIEMQWTG